MKSLKSICGSLKQYEELYVLEKEILLAKERPPRFRKLICATDKFWRCRSTSFGALVINRVFYQ
jgi:hypothetical protein